MPSLNGVTCDGVRSVDQAMAARRLCKVALPYTEVRGKECGSFRQVLSVMTAPRSSSSILPKRLVYPDVQETTVFTPSEGVL